MENEEEVRISEKKIYWKEKNIIMYKETVCRIKGRKEMKLRKM